MPTVGIGGITSHLTVGTGAIVPYQLIPPSVRNQFGLSPAGPNAVFVRLRPGVDPVSARRALNRIDAEMARPTNYQVTLQDVQRPAEIVNYRSMGTTPALLGLALALGATSALGLTLVASVRRRRREFAMLKTLGFTRRQLAASVAWQATISVGIGVVIGVPCGIVAGRFLWDLFADQIYVVPDPAVPIALIVGIGLGALVAANLVAALPGWVAARTRTALLLRAE
jgi:ABC-type antimicrobial peptide transport system permease subunit